MDKLKKIVLLFTIALSIMKLSAQSKVDSVNQSNSGLIRENMLHPLDMFTAKTLNKGEWILSQPPTLLPGYMFWGVTDNITLELDLTAWFIGIPDANIRIGIFKSNNFQIASETMLIYIPDKIDDLDSDKEHLLFQRNGISGYSRINADWYFSKNSYLNISAGISYSEFLRIENINRSEFSGSSFENYLEPAVSVGIDLRLLPWLSFHSTGYYGETFVYFENHPRKYQFTYGFRIAPFYKNKFGILRTFRIELASITAHFPDAKETYSLAIPVYPYIYWQWDWSKKNRK